MNHQKTIAVDTFQPDPTRVETPPLKICLLGLRSAPYLGGQGVYLKYLSRALVTAGHQVEVISAPPYPELDPGVKLIPVAAATAPNKAWLAPLAGRGRGISEWLGGFNRRLDNVVEPYLFGRRVLKYLRRHGHQYDIIHANQSLSYGMLALQKMGLPLVTTLYHPGGSDLDHSYRQAADFRQRPASPLGMQRRVARKLKHIVTVSQQAQRDAATLFGLQSSSMHVIHAGIDTEVFRPDPAIQKIPQRLMATVSSDTPVKGMVYLLRAVAMLLHRYPDLQLLLVGRPRPGGASERLIGELGLRRQVRCVSGISTEELVSYYNEANVVVVPSLYESFGQTAGEAMACGTAVVATRGGALPELVGEAAELVPVANSAALAGAIARLLDDTARCQALEVAGRSRIERHFDCRQAADKMLALYRWIIRTTR